VKKNASPLKETSSNAGLPSVASEFDTIFTKLDAERLVSRTSFPKIISTYQPISVATDGEKKVPTAGHQTLHNVYSPNKNPLGIDVVISASELQLPTAKKSDELKNFWSNLAVGNRNSLKETLPRISTPVLAKRLGYPLCQIFELIEAGLIICRNGLIPDEEAERLLHPKIEIKE
jgi:hypothetical protein